MPALVISLSLETFGRSSESDMVTFVTGLILGTDLSIRNWFGLFVRNGQKVYICIYYSELELVRIIGNKRKTVFKKLDLLFDI